MSFFRILSLLRHKLMCFSRLGGGGGEMGKQRFLFTPTLIQLGTFPITV